MAMNEDCLPSKNVAAAGIRSSSGGTLSSTRAESGTAMSSASTEGSGESATAAAERRARPPESKTFKNISEYVDDFTAAVERAVDLEGMNRATRSLNDTDCGDAVYKFVYDNVPGFATASAWLNKGVNFMTGLSTGVSLSGAMASSDFVQTVCDMLSKFYGSVNAFIEIFTKGAFVLFKKIDAMRERLETAMLNLTDAIMNCILDVLNDTVERMKIMLNSSLGVDWNALTKLMIDCPCLTSVVAHLTGCTRDDAGNDITNNAPAVILCVRDRFSFLDPVKLTANLQTMYEDYIKKYVKMIFGYLESWIVYVYNLLIKPLRSAVKKYAEMLMYKNDVTTLIDMVGPFRCFFIYTEEYRRGTKFKGMSVIDMINSFKQWVTCFEHACPQFSEKVKNRSKEIYKDLRLDDKYWRNAYEMDIYTVCIAARLDATTPRESMLRSMYSESPIDLILAAFRKSKSKGDDDPVTDDVVVAKVTQDEIAAYSATNDGKLPPEAPSSFDQAISFTDAPETENEVNVGSQPIGKDTEAVLVTMLRNLGNGTGTFYTEKVYQMVRFMGFYATSDAYVSAAQEVLDSLEHMDGDFARAPDAVLQSSDRRPPVYDAQEDVRVDYSPEDDYDAELCNALMSPAVYTKKRKADEDRIDFYERLYQGI